MYQNHNQYQKATSNNHSSTSRHRESGTSRNRESGTPSIVPENPKTWGPHLWLSLHAIAAGYPLEPTEMDKDMYRIHFENIANVLPCFTCKNNFHQILRRIPLHDEILDSRESLSRWVVELHNAVSKENGKPAQHCNWTYEMLEKLVDQTSGVNDKQKESKSPIPGDGNSPILAKSAEILLPENEVFHRVKREILLPENGVILTNHARILGDGKPEAQLSNKNVPVTRNPSSTTAKVIPKSNRMKQLMEIQKANAQRTKLIQMQRTYGYVGMTNYSVARRELHRNSKRFGAVHRNNSSLPRTGNLTNNRATNNPKPKRKGCGCGGRK